MAVSKSDLFDYIKDYKSGNARPCPKKDILASHGDDALPLLKELIDDGSIACRRGRNGGYYPVADAVAAEDSAESNEPTEAEANEVADQFAALQARLAAESENESEEQIPANP